MNNWYKKLLVNLICLMLIFAFTGCTSAPIQSNTEQTTSGFIPAKAGNYDSADTAVILNINTAECKITFQTTFIGKKYTLAYDGATVFLDKYGTGMSVKQLHEGDLVDIKFLKMWKRLDELKLAEGQFAFYDISDYQFSFDGKHVMIAGEQYTLDDNYAIVSDQNNIDIIDINPVDVLSFIGFDHKIYSIVVNQGHGYLRLVNDSYFIGGWIEVSQKQICKIEEDMIIAVPTGTYTITVSNAGSSGQETVTIEQGKEYEIDVSGWQTEAKYGDIIFSTTPENARVYIDGNVVDISEPVNLEYGLHQMIVVADGYQTISKYLKVGSEEANLDVVMEPKEKGVSANWVNTDNKNDENADDSDYGQTIINPPVSSNNATVSYNIINPPASTSSNATSNSNASVSANAANTISTSSNYKVYIDSPKDVEVYVEGVYVGMAPTSFVKKPGSVVVILRKPGYETRSYTLNLDSENKDVNYSFSELTALH